jgi:GAF domain-containing protein
VSSQSIEVWPFSEKQIALLQNFAAQRVIAMENARLLTETHEALEQQTATAEVLQIINSSPGDLAPVFDRMLDRALHLCGAAFGILWTYDGEWNHAAAIRGATPAYADFLTSTPHPPGRDNAHRRLLRGERFVHIADAEADAPYQSDDPIRRATVELGEARTILAVPLRIDEVGRFDSSWTVSVGAIPMRTDECRGSRFPTARPNPSPRRGKPCSCHRPCGSADPWRRRRQEPLC